MSKKSPQLRFEGFTDDWEERNLKDILREFSTKSKIENEYRVLSSTNVGMEFRDGRVSGTSNLGYKIIEDGDLVLSPQNLWLGNININDIGTGLVSPSYKTFNFTNIDSSFIKPQLRTPKMLEEYKNSSTQGASVVRRNLEIDSFYQIKIATPSIKEQEKIGTFFNNLDSLITLHQRKLDLLKEQKKGYLQKMFPKNGEKVPELRFEGFTDDWEQRKFGEMLVNLEAGVSVNSSDYDTGYFILKTSAIKMGNIDLLEVKSIVSEEVARAKTPLIKNSIIISRMNTPELVGASGLVRESIDNIFLPDRLWQGQVAGNFSPEWLIQSINIAANIKKIRDLATGTSGSMKNISKKSMLDLIINVPTLEEQQKIGSFFKQLDDVIALHQLKLDLLKEQKKGFLQKMFA
ncbi:restriction endonuclease subunit S [Enterococcus avium]|uniref:restriction endonuclease subunit S n=1 Tax=Enterococcus avium TaxID=33945 RepID=UPI002890AC5E|nr:restriction endonuclease subunit S [Enterococcus avium]MDT2490266.1 restriction endonuclease subunit S [Enterococcus avium]